MMIATQVTMMLTVPIHVILCFYCCLECANRNAGGASATFAAASGPSYTNGATTSYSAPASSAPLSEKVLVTKPLSQLRALAAQRGIRGNTRQELIRALTR